ncbi:MAG: glycosyltransferase [Planctomycetales bacterium]
MRVALLHLRNCRQRICNRVWESWNRIWPAADRFLIDQSDLEYLPFTARHRFQQSFPRTLSSSPYDLVLSTVPDLAAGVPWLRGNLHLSYVSSVAAFENALPENSHPHSRGLTNHLPHVSRWRHATLPPHTTLPVDHWILGSGTIRDLCGLPQDESNTVLYPPLNLQAFRPDFCRRESLYVLPCETRLPKNLPIAIEAARRMKRRLVVLAHGRNLQRLPHSPDFTIVPCLTDQDAANCYASCEAVIFPDVMEVDLSLIEAQVCGTPIVALDAGAAQEMLIDSEVAGVGTGVFFSEPTTDSLISALQELERRPQHYSTSLAWSTATAHAHPQFERRMRQLVQVLVDSAHTATPDFHRRAA